MEILYERCCGVDVHKKQITVCYLETSSTGRTKKKDVRIFPTFTEDLKVFCEWLKSNECYHVAMESTGVYWKPVFNILEEEGIEVCLVNARHMKNVPGRKTDVKDCEWIAKLFRQGLLRPSLIPCAEMRECRELIRRRKKLIQMRSSEINRLQKTLEEANVKLSSVATDILGASGTRMIMAILDGERDVNKLADLAQGTLVNKKSLLKKALNGNIKNHHVVLIRKIMDHIAFLNSQIEQLSQDLSSNLEGYEEDIAKDNRRPLFLGISWSF